MKRVIFLTLKQNFLYRHLLCVCDRTSAIIRPVSETAARQADLELRRKS